MDLNFQYFVLEIFKYGTIALGIIVLGLTIVASIAFYRSKDGQARAFSLLIQKAGALQLVSVLNIVVVIALLAILGKINSEAALAALTGIAGFVLGGMNRSSIISSKID